MAERTILIERPYAAVLESEFLHNHCSNCFQSNAQFPCPKQCHFATYCDEKCSSEDFPWHQFECAGAVKCRQENRKPNAESRTRIVARMLARVRNDNGNVSLSDRVPTYVKDRQFGELLSHYDKIKKDPRSVKRMQTLMKQFFDFYASTPLKDTTAKMFCVMFCTFRINSFCITSEKDTFGLGLYLNASRFNHSCNPSAVASFDGNRINIRVRSNVHPDEYSTEHRFNQLTIDYGTCNQSGCGYYITPTRQRVDSLKSRYFFRCLCTACVDSMAALIEERSANVECGSCHRPYIWTTKGQLQQLCRCEESMSIKTREEQRQQVLKLEKDWKKVMDETDCCKDPVKIIHLCEPLLKAAQPLWHKTENWRLAQVLERLATAYARCNVPYMEDHGSRAKWLFTLADFYDRIEWGHGLARQSRALAKVYEQRGSDDSKQEVTQ